MLRLGRPLQHAGRAAATIAHDLCTRGVLRTAHHVDAVSSRCRAAVEQRLGRLVAGPHGLFGSAQPSRPAGVTWAHLVPFLGLGALWLRGEIDTTTLWQVSRVLR